MWMDDYNKVSYTCITLYFTDDSWGFNSKVIHTYMHIPIRVKKKRNHAEMVLVLFVLDQAANVQAGLSQFVHNSCLARTRSRS